MKVYTITLGFVPARIWERSLDAYLSLRNPTIVYDHYFVDQHYPLGGTENRRELWRICCERGVNVLDPGRNLGLHGGFNWALARLPCGPEDIIIGYDPDSNPISPGFDGALIHALQLDPRLAWTSLMSGRAEPELRERGYTHRRVGHLDLWITHKPVVNSIVAWKYSFLKAVGGLSEPNQWYGGLEADMFSRMKSLGLEWGFLTGWHENDDLRNLQDKEYLWWKWKFAHLREWTGDFKSYVEAGCPVPSDLPVHLP